MQPGLRPPAPAWAGPSPALRQPGVAGAPGSVAPARPGAFGSPPGPWALRAAGCGLPLIAAAAAVRRRRGRGRCQRKPLAARAATNTKGDFGLFADIPVVSEDKEAEDVVDAKNSLKDALFAKKEPEEPCAIIAREGDLAIVRGGKGLFTNVKPGSLCIFSSGAKGTLLAWKESEEVAIMHVTEGEPEVGEQARSTGVIMATLCSSTGCCGRILDPRGEPLDGRPAPEGEQEAPLQEMDTFADFKGIEERTNRYRTFFTGVLGIDFSVPVGRGQTMLVQGTDQAQDKANLWPDLMAAKKGPGAPSGPLVNICVCRTMEEAEQLRATLERQGSWEQSVIVVADAPGDGAVTVAMNGAMALAEHLQEQSGEAMCLFDLEPMSRVWTALASAAGEYRLAKGIVKVDEWTDVEGTLIKESIAERRKFWFALISRAANATGKGSVTILAWLWEQAGGLESRQQKAYKIRVDAIRELPRIKEETREKMISKIEKEAADAGCPLDQDLSEIPISTPGVPNWEIEELKSITDGHVLLRPPSSEAAWGWHVDAYRSLARIGTDALHPALISIEAHKLRLKMLQGRDRANVLGDTRGALGTIDKKDSLELTFMELILEQPAGAPLSIEQEIVRVALVSNPNCKPLRAPGGCNAQNLDSLANQLLKQVAGAAVMKELAATSSVSEETQSLLAGEMDSLAA